MASSGSSPSAPPSNPLPRIFLACPNYKGASGAFIVSTLRLQNALRDRGTILHPWLIENESNIDRARGKAVTAFLATNASHLLFIDTDHGYLAEDILRMIDADKPIIGAVTCQKTFDFKAIVDAAREAPGLSVEACVAYGTPFNFSRSPEEFDDLMTPQLTKRIGTGLMLIRRDVVAAVFAAYYATHGCSHAGVYFVDMFKTSIDPETRDQIGTDYAFCDRAKACGFDTWIAPWTQTTHRGEYTFKASLMSMAESA